MTQEEKFDAIVHLLHHDGATLHFTLQAAGFGINIINPWTGEDSNDNAAAVNKVFDDLAYQEYLKKKEEFSKPKRNNKGQFTKR